MYRAFNLGRLIRSLIISIVLAAIMSIILGTISFIFNFSITTITLMSYITLAIALFIGSYYQSTMARRSSIGAGLLLAVTFILLTLILTMIINELSLFILIKKSIIIILSTLAGSMIGGH